MALPKRKDIAFIFFMVIFAMQITMTNSSKMLKNKCQNLPHFGLKGLINPIKNESTMCPGLENTCCSVDDFHGLKQWWELRDSKVFNEDIYLESKKSKRERQLVTVKTLTWSLLQKYSKFFMKAQSYMSKSNIDEVCEEGYSDLKNLREKFYEQISHDYLENAYSCWSKTNKMQTSFMCSLCDPDASDFLEISKGFFGVSTKTCETVMFNCLGMVNMNTSVVIPYLSALDKVSRCNSEGRLMGNLVNYELNDKLVSYEFIETCNSSGECEDLCENTLKIGGNLNNVLEGDLQFVLGVYANTMNWINKRFEIKHVNKFLKKTQEEIQESIGQASNNKRELYEVNKNNINYYKKFRYDNKLSVQNSMNRPDHKSLYNRNDEVSVNENQNRVLQAIQTLKEHQKKLEFMRPLTPYPGRYLILISEAEFNRRFRIQPGIPPGGRLIKAFPRKATTKKATGGRILNKFTISKMEENDSGEIMPKMMAKKERILQDYYERNDMMNQEEDSEQPNKMTIAQKARKLQEFEKHRGFIESKAYSILDWTQTFGSMIRKLKNKI